MDVDAATHPLWSASEERTVSSENARISRFGERFHSPFMIEEASEDAPSSENS
jgi:ribosomal protein L31